MEPVAQILLDYLRAVVYDPEHAALDLEALPQDFQDFGKGLSYFAGSILETMEFAKEIAQGNLDVPVPAYHNEMASSLKGIHAALKHLTWQTQQVAKGDYQQRVDFMGDFSEAFNTMTSQLAKQRLYLLQELESRKKENLRLIQNKNLYELLAVEQLILVVDMDNAEWLLVSREIDEKLAEAEQAGFFREWIARETKEAENKAEAYTTELEWKKKEGAGYYSVSVHPLRWKYRNALAFILTDITNQKERMIDWENLADRDMLTQLYNRRYAMRIFNQWLEEKRNFFLAFIDIDNLKYVNDQFGHSEGDRYIIRVANVLSEFSSEAIICRIGGDEFMLLAGNVEMEEARQRLELQNELLSSSQDSELGYESSISYGLVSIPDTNEQASAELLAMADERMYEHKHLRKKARSQSKEK